MKIMKFGLNEWELKKPLFCWMISMVYYKSKDQMKYLTNRTLLYHEFIHSIIKGKYIDQVKNTMILQNLNIRKRRSCAELLL